MKVKELNLHELSTGTACLTALTVFENPLLSGKTWLSMENISVAVIVVYDFLLLVTSHMH